MNWKTCIHSATRSRIAGLALALAACGGGDETTTTDAGTSAGPTSDPTDATAGPTTEATATTTMTSDPTTDGTDTDTDATDTDATTDSEVAIAPGDGFACMLDAAGVIRCAGENGEGQHGDGSTLSSTGSEVVHGEPWRRLAVGNAHVCAIDAADALYCWGDQYRGSVGDGTTPSFQNNESARPSPVQVGHDGPWVAVSAGAFNSCAIDGDGALWCWGPNDDGQLGNGGLGESFAAFAPDEVEGGASWRAVATTSGHTCGVQQDGTLWCWGANDDGQLGDGTTQLSSTPRQVGGDADWATVAVAASLSQSHTCAIRQDGALYCWGANAFGSLGVGDEDDRSTPTQVAGDGPWTSVAALFRSTCATKADGTLWCWGGNTSNGLLANGVADVAQVFTTPQQVGGDADWRAVQLEGQNGCALLGEDRGRCWGDNATGALGVMTSGPYEDHYTPVEFGDDLRNPPGFGWSAVEVGATHSCARAGDGALWCWGGGAGGDLGSGFDDVSCNLSDPSACTRTAPRKVDGGGTWGAFSAGGAGTCAIRPSGALWCWGDGALDEEAAYAPAQVGAATSWSSVTVAEAHRCGLQSPGTLWCWGSNQRGQIGDGQGGPGVVVADPAQIGAADDWTKIAKGFSHTCAIRQPGTLWCWGANDRGQLGVGTAGSEYLDPSADEHSPTQVGVASDWVDVCGGRYHSCGVRQGGELLCWGDNANGLLGNGAIDASIADAPQQVGAETDWQEVACGETIACARKADGSVRCWGSNYNGGVGAGELMTETFGAPTLVVDLEGAVALSSGRANRTCALLADDSVWCWGGGPLGDHNVFSSPRPRQVVEGDELP
ncbi:MAG: hypothetical protein KC636_20065 [Myxococcales bacterium]|nr:hypothetical protein [Myxococcales bacterium]